MSHRRRYSVISIIIIVVVIIVAAYYVATLYMQAQARNTLNQAITAAKSQYPDITEITYHNVDISPLSLINHRYQINDVVVTPKDTLYQIKVNHVRICHYTLGSDAIPTELTVHLDDISAPQMMKQIKALTGVAAPAALWNQQPNWSHLDVMVHYQSATKTIAVRVILKHNHKILAHYDLTIAHFLINTPLNAETLSQSLPIILKEAYILNVNSDINIHLAPSAAVLAQQVPELAASLKTLGYQTFDLSITGNSHYSSASKTTLTNAKVVLKDGATITLYGKQIQPRLITLNALMSVLSDKPASKNYQDQVPLLAELRVQYQDQGLFNRVLTLYGQQIQQSPAQLQLEMGTALMVIPTIQQIPPLRQAAIEISRFIEMPGTLTVDIKPEKPIRIDQAILNYQHAMSETPKDISDTPLTEQQKRKKIQQYHNQLTSQLLDLIGFTVTAS